MPKKIQISSFLSRKVAEANLKTVTVALLVAIILLSVVQYITLRSALMDDVAAQAEAIAEQCAAAVLFSDQNDGQQILARLSALQSMDGAAIVTPQLAPLAEYRRAAAVLIPIPTDFRISPFAQFGVLHLDLVRSIEVDQRRVGLLVLRVGLSQLYFRLIAYIGMSIAAIAGSLLIARMLGGGLKQDVLEMETHLQLLAHTDAVTGLLNRHAFSSRLQQALSTVTEQGGCVDLLLLDLDNFKLVNDTLGHHGGDHLLRLVAERLNSVLRESDIICRVGGDEFAIILETRTRKSGSERIAEKLIESLAQPFIVDNQEVYVTGSIGISCFPDGGVDRETLTRNADTAMYQAKAKGKNAFEKFHPEMNLVLQKRSNIETNLRKALEREELAVYYQPKVDLVDHKVIGFEALLRWNHPEMGMISPTDFIPIAEESGLIIPIGRWVIATACHQMAAWKAAGFEDIKVAVNLSVRQTKNITLIDDVLNSLRKSGLEPRQLELEITESMLMDDIQDNVDLLENLQAAGIFLSIDDFGTGYSSMAYLKRLPIDQLKIDRAFVKDIPGNGDDEAIVSAIVSMAHSLGIAVVAEGAETIEQINFLRSVGCDSVQGYYIAQPMPAHEVEAFLLKQRGAGKARQHDVGEVVPLRSRAH
ncbi:MAG: EAL domain-containing protein [Pseudomonadota bacterium]